MFMKMATRLARTLVQITLLLLFALRLSFAQQQSTLPKATPTPKPTPAKISSHVVVIVVSGLGADLLKEQHDQLPKLNEMLSQSFVANAVEGVYPSLAQPAQATIATGMLPADHGVFTDDEPINLMDVLSEPGTKTKKNVFLWESVTKAGLSVAAIGYKLTKDATIKYNFPDYPAQLPSEATANKMRKADVYTQALHADALRAKKACELIETGQPNLLLVNLSSVGVAQSQFGTTSKEVSGNLRELDAWLDQMLISTAKAKIKAETTFMLIADSGKANVENEFNPNVVLAKKGWLTLDAQGHLATWKAIVQPLGGAAAVFVKNQADEKAVETLFREIHQNPDSPVWRIFNRQEISRMGAIPQAALMLDAAPGYCFGGAITGGTSSKVQIRSSGGYSPQRSEMRPVLIAFGKGIKPKANLGIVRLTDLAPTVARILGIQHPTFRGRVLTEVLQP